MSEQEKNEMIILICDDNIAVHESLGFFLREAGMGTVSAFEGKELLRILGRQKIDLVVLDIMMPGKPGTELLKEIRSISDIPVLMLSALGEEENRIEGLCLGADDYVTKPFSPKEVVVRIQRILHRLNPREKNTSLFYGNLVLNPEALTASIGETPLALTPKEFSVLECLAEKPDKVLSRDIILDEVWGFSYLGDGRSVDTIIRRLRMKLEKANASCAIRSVYSVGYSLVKK